MSLGPRVSDIALSSKDIRMHKTYQFIGFWVPSLIIQNMTMPWEIGMHHAKMPHCCQCRIYYNGKICYIEQECFWHTIRLRSYRMKCRFWAYKWVWCIDKNCIHSTEACVCINYRKVSINKAVNVVSYSSKRSKKKNNWSPKGDHW